MKVGVALTLAFALWPMLLGSNPFVLNVMILAGIFGIAALALDLALGQAGVTHLGLAASFGLGGYATGILTVRYGWEPIAALLAGLAFNLAIAFVVGKAVLRLRAYFFAIATLGLNIIAANVILSFEALSGGYSGLPGVPPFSVLGQKLGGDLAYYYTTWGLAAVCLVLARNLMQSRSGRAIRALRDSEDAAQALGIDVAGYRLKVFLISTALASVAGSLYAHYLNYIGPNSLDILTSFEFLVILVLGGSGTLVGPFLGAIVLEFLSAGIVGFDKFEVLIMGALLAILLIFLPAGLAGTIARWLRHRGRREVFAGDEAAP